MSHIFCLDFWQAVNYIWLKAASLTVTTSLKHFLHPETPSHPCDNQRQAQCIKPGAAKVSELHLYLPSSLCGDEEQDAETEEMRYEFWACRPLRVKGELPSASCSWIAPWIISLTSHLYDFTLLFKKLEQSSITGLMSDVRWRVGRQKYFPK